MAEHPFIQEALYEYGHLPIRTKLRNGIEFKKPDGSRAVYLGNFPMHYRESGEWKPIETRFKRDGSGVHFAPGLDLNISPEGAIRFGNSRFALKPEGVAYVTRNPLSFDIQERFPLMGQTSTNGAYILEAGIYRYEAHLHEKNRLKEYLHISQKPDNLSGEFLVFSSRVLLPDFPEGIAVPNGFTYDRVRLDNGIAWDAEGNEAPVRRYIVGSGVNKRLVTGVSVAWLDSAIYPVVIDPAITLQPDGSAGKDAYASQDLQDDNYGNSTVVPLGHHKDPPTRWRRPWIEFDLSSLQRPTTCLTATFSLYLLDNSLHTLDGVVFAMLLVDWVELEATHNIRKTGVSWTSSAGYNGTDASFTYVSNGLNFTGASTTGIFYDWDIKNIVQQWINGTTNNGLVGGWSASGGDWSNKSFASSDHGTVGARPKLYIEYVSKPTGGMYYHFQ